MNRIAEILLKKELIREDLITLLSADKEATKLIYEKAAEVKKEYVGNKVYLRGLVELSNICSKNMASAPSKSPMKCSCSINATIRRSAKA